MRKRTKKKMLKSFLFLEDFPREREEWLREHFLDQTTFLKRWYGVYVHMRKKGLVMNVTISPHSIDHTGLPQTNKEKP